MNETESQAIDAFVSAFETEAAKIGIPKKLAACGAIFTIGAQARVGLKILLIAPPSSGKKMLLRNFIRPLTDAEGGGIFPNSSELKKFLSRCESEGVDTFADCDYADKGHDRIFAEWGGSVLICIIPPNLGRRQFRGFERVVVSPEEGKFGHMPSRRRKPENIPDISGLRERLGKLPAVDKDSLIEKMRELQGGNLVQNL